VRIPRAQGPARRARRAPVAAIAPRQHAAPQTTLVRDDLLADAQEARQSVGHLASMTRKKEKKKKTCLWRTWFCVTKSYSTIAVGNQVEKTSERVHFVGATLWEQR
jgi:hypothetical protein